MEDHTTHFHRLKVNQKMEWGNNKNGAPILEVFSENVKTEIDKYMKLKNLHKLYISGGAYYVMRQGEALVVYSNKRKQNLAAYHQFELA